MSKSSLDYIAHILIEIDFLKRKSLNKTEEDFASDEMMQRAFTRSLEIIGEAVKNIDDEVKAQHSEINWKSIAGMRDKVDSSQFWCRL